MRLPVAWFLAAAVGALPLAGSAIPGGARPPERATATIVALDASQLAGGEGVRLRIFAEGRLPSPRVL